jgi:hypothetical protein
MIPLNLVPLYAADSYPNIFFDLERNTTEWNIFMSEFVLAGNEIASLMLANLPSTLPGAKIGQLLALLLLVTVWTFLY